MRFIRKIVPPQSEKRRHLLKKIEQFKGVDNANAMLTSLRQALAACEGYTEYYIEHRGITVYAGDDKTPKKQLLALANEETFRPLIQRERKERRLAKTDMRKRYCSSTGESWAYVLKGGVFERPGVIANKDKGIRRWWVERSKKPTTSESYIGLELEYASALSTSELRDVVADMRMHKQVRVVSDRSIATTREHPYQVELCVLSKYSELSETLGKLRKLATPRMFRPNESCGLHVHLDARHDDVKRMYANLVKMQYLLFSLAEPHRRHNTYCHPVLSSDITAPCDEDHYAAISKLSYAEHRSVEVRIHHSTLDLDLVEKWVRLLRTIADFPGHLSSGGASMRVDELIADSVQQLKGQIKPPEDLLKYVEERLLA